MSKKFYGWQQVIIVALATGLGYSMVMGALAIANATMKSSGQVVMSASVFGLSYSVFSLMQGPPQPIVANLVNKYGSKKVMAIGFAFIAVLGLGLSNFIVSGPTFIIIYGLLFGISGVVVNQVAPQTIINNWFHLYRGRAQSISRAISSSLQAIGPVIATYVIVNFGAGNFKLGWYFVGIGAAFAFLLTFFIKENPEKYGQNQDGLTSHSKKASEKLSRISTVYKRPAGQDISEKEAHKLPIFWLMVLVSTIGFMCLMINAFNQVHFVNQGVLLTTISSALGIGMVVNIIFVIVASMFLDRIEPGFILGGIFLLYGVACLLATQSSSTPVVFATCMLTTILQSTVMTLIPILYGNYFGRASFAKIQGFSLMCGGLLSSTTGLIGGMIADKTGSYTIAYYLYGTLGIVAGILAIFVVGNSFRKKYKREGVSKMPSVGVGKN